MSIQTTNPATAVLLKKYPFDSEQKINKSIELAHDCFLEWKAQSFEQRRHLMLKLALQLSQHEQELALVITNEMGKPITAAKAEVQKCAWVCEHYANEAEAYLQPRIIKTEMKKTMVCYQPIGVIFAIMPWNFPLWQVFRFAAPTIMAGNTVLLKHAPISSGAGRAIVGLFSAAGFPAAIFQQIIVNNEQAAKVIANDRIAAVTLTGSERAGREVGIEAARHLKKSVLELGGNDPYIILNDANLNWAAKCIVDSRLNNCGQVCIAAKRIIVVAEVHDSLVKKIVDNMSRYQMGDPLDDKTNLGPMARDDLRTTVHQQVLTSIELGAQLIMGGQIPLRPGFYYPPTLLINVCKGMPAFDEELFGPVIAIISAQDEKEAIAMANDSLYGLAAAVFTEDLIRGEEIARTKIDVGACFVNALVASDPRVPFGGIKHSGHGRELSREGILEFVNIKTVAIRDNY